MVSMDGNIYHEKQVKEFCALHALNNLFQEEDAFTKAELDNICYSLSPNDWINPHKSLFGFGNYDINVIMAALQKKNCEAIWFDKRKDPNCLILNNIKGFILNLPIDSRFKFGFSPMKSRHWIAIREVEGNYYNLDSKLDSPKLIGSDGEVVDYLREELKCQEKELFVVVSEEVEISQSWLVDGNDAANNSEPSSTTDSSDSEQNETEQMVSSTEMEVEWQESDVCNCPSFENETGESGDTGGHESLDEEMIDVRHSNSVSGDAQGNRTTNTPSTEHQDTK